MASTIKHSFKEKALAIIRGDWANRVARRVSYWLGEEGIDVTIPENPDTSNPIRVRLNVKTAAPKLAGEMMSKTGLGLKLTPDNPFMLRASLNQRETAVAQIRVYLPSLAFTYDGEQYTIQSGSSTGFVADGTNGWYRITGITGGNIYLVDSTASGATTKTAKFATAALADSSKMSYLIGSVNGSTGAETQYSPPMSGKMEKGGGTVELPVKPLTLKAVVNSGKTAVTELRVYLPDTTIGFGRTDYPFRTGTTTGYISAVSGEAGWYKINGITTGTIWLVDDSIQQTVNTVVIRTPRVKFATAGLSTQNRVSHLVGKVSYTSGQAAASVVQVEEPVKGWVGDCESEHDGQGTIDISLPMSESDTQAFRSEGHTLNQDKWQRGISVLSRVTSTGDTNTITPVSDADGHQQPCGLKLRVITRVVRAFNCDYFVYRELEFDKNGMLRLMTEEKGAMKETNGLLS